MLSFQECCCWLYCIYSLLRILVFLFWRPGLFYEGPWQKNTLLLLDLLKSVHSQPHLWGTIFFLQHPQWSLQGDRAVINTVQRRVHFYCHESHAQIDVYIFTRRLCDNQPLSGSLWTKKLNRFEWNFLEMLPMGQGTDNDSDVPHSGGALAYNLPHNMEALIRKQTNYCMLCNLVILLPIDYILDYRCCTICGEMSCLAEVCALLMLFYWVCKIRSSPFCICFHSTSSYSFSVGDILSDDSFLMAVSSPQRTVEMHSAFRPVYRN